MLSKVLSRLGNFGGSKQEGCRGFLGRAVGRKLCAPEAAQTPVTGPPCPTPGLAHPGTTTASSQTLLFKGLALSEVANAAANRLGVVSPGYVVPCSCCPSSRASGGCLSQNNVAWKASRGADSASFPRPQTCKGSTCKGFSSLCTPGLKGNPVPFTPDPDRARSSPPDHSSGCKFDSHSSWTRVAKRDEEREERRGLLEHHEGGRTGGRGGAGARRPDVGAGYSVRVWRGKGGSLQSPPTPLACER